jgi:radical SAM protein (TIGR04043 family)
MLSRDAVRRLCVDLQSTGIRFLDSVPGSAGGAGPADSRYIIINGQCLSVPACGWYVCESPYRAEPDGTGSFVLYRHDTNLCTFQTIETPELYQHSTSSGMPYSKIARMHGRDCLASTLYQDCQYRGGPEQCQFCGIGLSLENGSTILHKQPSELAEVARHAARTAQATHVTLTSGSRVDEQAATAHLAECVRMIKQHSGLPVHIQICPPESRDVLTQLHAAGADTIGLHIETLCMDTLKRVAPAKAGYGLERYRSVWQQAVELFGVNQVSSFLIAGLGESAESLLDGARQLCRMGVFPYVLPLRPVPGTPLGNQRPPAADDMAALYRAVAAVLKEYGMSSRAARAGCVRCGACSSLSLFEDDAL